jgi:hypothetical protein
MTIAESCRLQRLTYLFAAATVLAACLGFALPAAAVAPFALTDQITDQVGAVAGDEADIRAAFDSVHNDYGVRMWVVFVDTFDGVQAQRWADATFQATRLGADDFVLAVAVGDRQYGYVVANDFLLSDAALTRVAGAAEQHLAENPAMAAIAAAEAMQDQIARAGQSAPTSEPGGSQGIASWLFFAATGLAVVAFIGNGLRRVRKGLPFSPSSSGGGHNSGFGRDPWLGGHDASSGGGDTRGGGGTRGGSGSY